MRRKISERGSVLLLEMLIVISILGVLLAFSAPSFMRLRMSQQASQALATVRAIQNAETFYLQIYHNGYVDPGVLAGTGIAVPATCDAPLLLGGAQAQIQTNGYIFQFTPGPAPAVLGAGCTTPGSTTFSLTANPASGQGRSFFVNEFGIIHYSDSGPANSASPAWFWWQAESGCALGKAIWRQQMTIKNLQAKLANRTGSAMDAPSNLVQGQVLSSENARIN